MSVFTGHTCNSGGYSGSRPKEERQRECSACQRLAQAQTAPLTEREFAPLPQERLEAMTDPCRNGPITVAMAKELLALRTDRERLHTLRPASEYHEDMGFVLWHHLPIQEPPEVGMTPDELPEGYPEGWHTHFSPLPDCNLLQDKFDAAMGGKA